MRKRLLRGVGATDVDASEQQKSVPEMLSASGRRLDLGGACNALSLSPSRSMVAVAGRDVLKLVSISNARFDPQVWNLRTGGKINLTFSSNDVQWNPKEYCKNLLCTAATNGKVIIWNLEKVGGSKQERILTDHTRTVNRVKWHPFEAQLVLSGSQDGTIKLWDIRSKRSCQQTITGTGASVRDIEWSPFSSNILASGLESGLAQIWDIRSPRHCAREINAHQGLLLSVNWHPNERNVLATGGRDRSIKVWRIHEETRPLHEIQTIASVARILWRPGFPNHIASTSTLFDSKIHVWSTTRPHVPTATFCSHTDVSTGIQWFESGNQLLSCSKDANVAINDISEAVCPYQHMRTTGISWSSFGELAIVNDAVDRSTLCSLKSVPQPFAAPETVRRKKSSSIGKVHILSPVLQNKEKDTVDTIWTQHADFDYFAIKYRLSGDSLGHLLHHNQQVAESAERPDLVHTWTLLQHLFVDNTANNQLENALEDILLAQHELNGALESPYASLTEEIDDISEFHSQSPIGEAYARREDFLRNSRNNQDEPMNLAVTNDVTIMSLFECLPRVDLNESSLVSDILDKVTYNVIVDMLANLVEQGDVQTCVTIVAVLQDRIPVRQQLVRQWFASYIELLHRRRLWSCANEVILLSPDEAIKQMNQNGTKVHQNCAKCGRAMEHPGASCRHCCLVVAKCSLCRQRVNGLFAWCQGCGHGGHLQHLQEWFACNTQCPAGCQHKCASLAHNHVAS